MTNISDVEIIIKETPAQIAKMIGKAIASDLDKRIGVAANKAILEIRKQAAVYLNKSQIADILQDDLRGQLGLTPAKARSAVNGIIAGITNSVMYTYTPIKYKNRSFTGGFSIHVQPEDFTNIFASVGLDSVIRYYSMYYKKVVELDWLNWILMRGDAIIVTDGQFTAMAGGRSGQGKMMRTGSINVWKVPSSISGTQFDNIITRTLRESGFLALVKMSIQKYMK